MRIPVSFCAVCAVAALLGRTLVDTAGVRRVAVQTENTPRIQESQDPDAGRHLGTPEEALIGVEVRNTSASDAPTVRHGCGFILRCDGFVVVPYELFNMTQSAGATSPDSQTWTFTLRPGSSTEQVVRMNRRTRCFVEAKRRLGYAVFKLDGAIHIPALRTLLPDSLKPGDPVEIVWREWDAARHQYGPLTKRSSALAAPAESAAPGRAANADGAASGAPHAGSASERIPGFIRFIEPVQGVPSGAIVVGPGGMAIGIVPGREAPSAREGFISFARLDDLTNCVTALPTTDEAFLAAHPDADEHRAKETPGSMVDVPGGPVALPPVILDDQRDMEGASVACVAPFKIDKFEVTNAEYLAFWKSLPERERDKPAVQEAILPLGWAALPEPFPTELDNLPVLGVPLAGARAYARWAGKRLPTPYEWIKAAMGPRGIRRAPEWVNRYIAERQAAWADICRAHLAYLAARPDLRTFQIIERQGETIRHESIEGNLRMLPWLPVVRELKQDSLWSYRTLQAHASALSGRWKDPLSVLAIGSRDYDVSPYGARDMLLNANELFSPNPLPPIDGRTRWIALDWNPITRNPDGSPPQFTNICSCFLPGNGHVPALGFGEFPYSQLRFSRLAARRFRERYPGDPPEPLSIDVVSKANNVDDMLLLCTPINAAQFEVCSDFTIETDLSAEGPQAGWLGIGNPNRAVHYLPADSAVEFHRELGLPAPSVGTRLLPPGRWLAGKRRPDDLVYILPVGFRCAR